MKLLIAIYLAFLPVIGFCQADDITSIRTEHKTNTVITDFTKGNNLKEWHVEDDFVMGGKSQGSLTISKEGHALFSGKISLENGGGFSSVQTFFEPIDVSDYSKALLRVKGDGKRYYFRVQSTLQERHSYVLPFNTTGQWQIVEIPFNQMYAKWRGNRLSLPNYPGKTMAHTRFLIANGRAESFELLIDSVVLK